MEQLPEEVRKYIRRITSIAGKKRMEKLSKEERTELARKAALARWRKRDAEQEKIPQKG